MSAPVASETRSPFRASSEISACSGGGPSPAATSSAPSSLRLVHRYQAHLAAKGIAVSRKKYRAGQVRPMSCDLWVIASRDTC